MGPSRPFFYIYRSTYVDLPSKVLPATTPAEAGLPSRCMVMGRDDTLNLLGPFAEIYQTARAALGAVLESEPSKKEGESEEGSALNLAGSAAQDAKV